MSVCAGCEVLSSLQQQLVEERVDQSVEGEGDGGEGEVPCFQGGGGEGEVVVVTEVGGWSGLDGGQ